MPVDPNALATWANAVTVSRILVSPLLFTVIPLDNAGSWLAAWLWFALCVSDVLDGYLARRHGATRSGAFLDPLADKVLVLGAMFTLVNRGMFSIWPVVIIAIREVIVSVYRVVVGAKGVSVPASRIAKIKTLSQQISIGFALAPFSALDMTYAWKTTLWLAVSLTIISGTQYAVRAFRPGFILRRAAK
ncbi:MAG: CDP-diacylglycerol--glycerol-3-phosphate 3-phosphatidyltransferase [Actinobacteria bacterium]|jgi:CDP-diacylglycerol--glycerol-3-phosphate 3-phosphatidyltransferase|nr:CDP-diacylglycerol--glycerol-3-phosphate 3-phosphatidyltransferase [Ilumatobacteraceae bacterium]MCX6531918.1 CDP-diacylglycerol--glycerol-3-phosphate 3-phosphatidyltransferase [Actinomycetota bacterium]